MSYINHGGLQRGIEFYKGKAILYGQPPLYLQNNEVTKLPLAMKLRLGIGIDGTISQLLKNGISNRERAAAAGGQTHAFSGIGSAVHVAVFGANATLKDVRIYPTEEYIIEGQRIVLACLGSPIRGSRKIQSSDRAVARAVKKLWHENRNPRRYCGRFAWGDADPVKSTF